VEVYVCAQVKEPGLFVCRHFPGLCQGGDETEVFIRLHQGVVQLVDGPHDASVLGKSRVQGGDAVRFIVMKDFFPVGGGGGMAGCKLQA
jgi:hypothetical protein